MRLHATAFSFTKNNIYNKHDNLKEKTFDWVKVFRKTKVKIEKRNRKNDFC